MNCQRFHTIEMNGSGLFTISRCIGSHSAGNEHGSVLVNIAVVKASDGVEILPIAQVMIPSLSSSGAGNNRLLLEKIEASMPNKALLLNYKHRHSVVSGTFVSCDCCDLIIAPDLIATIIHVFDSIIVV